MKPIFEGGRDEPAGRCRKRRSGERGRARWPRGRASARTSALKQRARGVATASRVRSLMMVRILTGACRRGLRVIKEVRRAGKKTPARPGFDRADRLFATTGVLQTAAPDLD